MPFEGLPFGNLPFESLVPWTELAGLAAAGRSLVPDVPAALARTVTEQLIGRRLTAKVDGAEIGLTLTELDYPADSLRLATGRIGDVRIVAEDVDWPERDPLPSDAPRTPDGPDADGGDTQREANDPDGRPGKRNNGADSRSRKRGSDRSEERRNPGAPPKNQWAQQTPEHHQTPQNPQTPEHQQTPQNQRTPKHPQPPQNQQTPEHQRTPENRQPPQNQQAPEHQQASKNQQAPEDQQTPRNQKAPKNQRALQDQQTPEHRQEPKEQQTPRNQRAPKNQRAQQKQQAPEHPGATEPSNPRAHSRKHPPQHSTPAARVPLRRVVVLAKDVRVRSLPTPSVIPAEVGLEIFVDGDVVRERVAALRPGIVATPHHDGLQLRWAKHPGWGHLTLEPTVKPDAVVLTPTTLHIGQRKFRAPKRIRPIVLPLPELPKGLRLTGVRAEEGELVLHTVADEWPERLARIPLGDLLSWLTTAALTLTLPRLGTRS